MSYINSKGVVFVPVCFMTGHAQASEELLPEVIWVAERLINEFSVTEFLVGRYGDFDRLAAQAIRELKQRYPDIRLSLLLPYYVSDGRTETVSEYDGTVYPEGLENVPYRYAIVRANQWAVDGAAHLLVYHRYTTGNTHRLLEYARRAERKGRLRIWKVGDEG